MECWREVSEWEGFYEVSDEGRVRSVDRRHPVVNRFGNIENRLHRGKDLKPTLGKNGYLTVSFTRPGGVREWRYVHDLVALAFLGQRPNKHEVCHCDGSKVNNARNNLRYDTRSSNALDRHDHGTMNPAKGEKHYFHKLTEQDVLEIRADPRSSRKIAPLFGVSGGTIRNVRRGVQWKHVD